MAKETKNEVVETINEVENEEVVMEQPEEEKTMKVKKPRNWKKTLKNIGIGVGATVLTVAGAALGYALGKKGSGDSTKVDSEPVYVPYEEPEKEIFEYSEEVEE